MSELRECPKVTKYLAVQWIDDDKMVLSGSLYFDTKQECIDWCESQPKFKQFPNVHYTLPTIHPFRPTEDRLRERVRDLEARLSQIAHNILLAVDAYINAGDAINTLNLEAHEAYHQLYLASDPDMELLEPWRPLEEMARRYRETLAGKE